jgi:hypothetical protein
MDIDDSLRVNTRPPGVSSSFVVVAPIPNDNDDVAVIILTTPALRYRSGGSVIDSHTVALSLRGF